MTVGAGRGAGSQRRDARRNRELLVEAAHEVFTEQGLQAPLDVIARRAGVGNATLYRHFPTRADLVTAVYHHQIEACAEAGPKLLAEAAISESVHACTMRAPKTSASSSFSLNMRGGRS